MRTHPFIIIFESIISTFYHANRRPHDGILDAPIDGPWQFQPGWLGASLFVFPTGHPNKSDAAVSVQLRSVLEPPWRVEIGKNRRRANQTDAWNITPRFNDGIFTGIGAELFLCDLHLLLGGIIANPQHVQLSF